MIYFLEHGDEMYIVTHIGPSDVCPNCSCNFHIATWTKKILHNNDRKCSNCVNQCHCGEVTFDLINDEYIVDGAIWCEVCEECCMCPNHCIKCRCCNRDICPNCEYEDELCRSCFEGD